MDEQARGIFIPETDLPKNIWAAFFYLAKSQNLTPRQYIAQMIRREIQDAEDLRKPFLDQIIKKSVQYFRALSP